MKKRSIILSLLMAAILAVPVYAGYSSWIGPDGETLYGQTWLWDYACNGYTCYDGNARTWRSTPVFRIRTRGETYNNCDYWHKISDRTGENFNTTYVETGPLLAGSSQCQSMTTVQIAGTHLEQLYSSGGPWFGGYTQETWSVP